MSLNRKRTKVTSFYMHPLTKDQLSYIADVFGESPSAVIRRLITDTYSILHTSKNLDREVKNIMDVVQEGKTTVLTG